MAEQQAELDGMPEPAVLRRVVCDGRCVVYDFDVADTGMRAALDRAAALSSASPHRTAGHRLGRFRESSTVAARVFLRCCRRAASADRGAISPWTAPAVGTRSPR